MHEFQNGANRGFPYGKRIRIIGMRITSFGMHNKPQPRKCCDCGKKLPDAIYNGELIKPLYRKPRFYQQFTIECKCGVILVWSYPNVWKRYHEIPLWEGVVIQVAE
jgi:hypothetical protein